MRESRNLGTSETRNLETSAFRYIWGAMSRNLKGAQSRNPESPEIEIRGPRLTDATEPADIVTSTFLAVGISGSRNLKISKFHNARTS